MKQCQDCGNKIKSESIRCVKCNHTYMIKTFYNCSQYIPCRTITSWKSSAEKRNIRWDITPKQLDRLYKKQNGKCALTGRTLTGKQNDPNKISLDRKDNKKHYEISNVHFVTTEVNYAKQSTNINDFIELCRSIAKYDLENKNVRDSMDKS